MIPKESTSTELIHTGKSFIIGVILVSGGAASSVAIDDSVDGSGSVHIRLKALANDSKVAHLGGAIPFSTGIYSTLAGAGAKVYIYLQ